MLGMLSEKHFPEDMMNALKGFQLGMQIIIFHDNVPSNYIRNIKYIVNYHHKILETKIYFQISECLFEQQWTEAPKIAIYCHIDPRKAAHWRSWIQSVVHFYLKHSAGTTLTPILH